MRYLIAALAALMLIPASANAVQQDAVPSKQKQERIAAHGYPRCKTWTCAATVKKHRARRARLALRTEMLRYRANPMPYCTWGPESGVRNGQWSMVRYRMWNIGSSSMERASGKFQIIGSTWRAHGGTAYARYAAWAKPVHQERVARRIALGQGLDAWVNC